MNTTENLAVASRLYAAFSAGDYGAVLETFSDDIEWTQPGSTSVSGVHRGRDEVSSFFMTLIARGLGVEALDFFANGDRVVALINVELAGLRANEVDVITFKDGSIVAVEHIGDTEMLAKGMNETVSP